ncbi:tol-pal system-associated acyl-CoA thioesterase [Kangiella profundi]|uniref:Tol-pal system-associated acyl-CoA thioesterase n=1 Tax=Kangiella profundi TaxID=1561924 RepID=A0A2K9B310_9GAMM|nr:tol-pal system-associated acyl-CoA thioesterase [Kangiella profundi]AUD79308.1 tol-pal system-associated acyl-CoA thioesterase [Kangiella profundi]GGE99654.1 tol-pal system-associated acyl-CoA thioesterase [Kangiella profundi]
MSVREFIWPVRVYYEDTDVAGVVFYANYLRFYERGRTEWLRSLGWEQDILIDKGLAFAVAHVDAKYLLPARFNDKLLIKTRIASVRRTSVIFEQEIVTDDEQQLLVNKATIRVACVDMKTMKPAAMPDYLKEEIARDWC